MKIVILIVSLVITACSEIPVGLEPVTGFDVNRYTGKWYEIARLDNYFEEGLDQITADYQLNNDGSLTVVNSGRDVETGERKYVRGTAYFRESPTVGSLKVSFFGPFYGGYHIIELDKKDYQYAMIAGSDRGYLWILSRTPALTDDTLKRLTARADQLGFQTESLILPDH